MRKLFCLLAVVVGLGSAICRGDDPVPQPEIGPAPQEPKFDTTVSLSRRQELWPNGVGEGFGHGTRDVGFSAGAGFGLHVGGHKNHDLVLGVLHYGWVFSDVVGDDHWFRGNWELLGEAFGGAQYRPRTAYVAGATVVIRYNFATGTRFVPFIDGGAGPTITDIGRPDLGSLFNFNLQAGGGVRYFFQDNAAIIAQYRYLHMSNAGIREPNPGVNTSMFFLGFSWFF
jgi:lipid A 3-O-deacylase